MPTGKSDFSTKLASTGLHDRADQRTRGRQSLVMRDFYTMLGTEASTEFIDLGPLLVAGATICVEKICIKFAGAPAINVSGKLAKVSAAGVVTDISAAIALTGTVVALVPATGNVVTLERDERLRWIWNVITTVGAGRTLHFEIPYDVA